MVVCVMPSIQRFCNKYAIVQIQMLYAINCSVVCVTMTSLLLCELLILMLNTKNTTKKKRGSEQGGVPIHPAEFECV